MDNEKRGISRRTFLMGALASATLPSVFTTRGYAGTGPNDTMLIGCIGVGRQGTYDMKEALYRGLDHNVRIVAVCDVDKKRMAAAKALVEKLYGEEKEQAGNYPGCKEYADYRELLKRDDLDGVIIVTPDHAHAHIATAAARAGKDIYLEKPMTFTIAEGQALIKAVRDNKRVLQVGSQQRSGAYFHKVCELVRNGRAGKIHTIKVGLPEDKGTGNNEKAEVPAHLDYDMWSGPVEMLPYVVDRTHPLEGFGRPGWLQNEQYTKGMITGWGSHMNDIAQWGHGSDDTCIVEIEAKGEFPDRGSFNVHTNFKAEAKYADGVKLLMETGPAGVRFEGDEGWLFVTRDKMDASDPKLIKEKLPESAEKLYKTKGHMQNWYECMRDRKDPIAKVETGHHSNSICLLTHIAMKVGRKLEWDPAAERFKNDEEANKVLDYKHRDPWTV